MQVLQVLLLQLVLFLLLQLPLQLLLQLLQALRRYAHRILSQALQLPLTPPHAALELVRVFQVVDADHIPTAV